MEPATNKPVVKTFREWYEDGKLHVGDYVMVASPVDGVTIPYNVSPIAQLKTSKNLFGLEFACEFPEGHDIQGNGRLGCCRYALPADLCSLYEEPPVSTVSFELLEV